MSLTGGCNACEARLELASATETKLRLLGVSARMTLAFKSLEPAVLTPLKTLSARPSQNCRWLKTALKTDGVLRGSTRRVFGPPL